MKKISEYLTKQEILFKKFSSKVQDEPSTHSVHQLRLATRRIRAVIWLLGHSSNDLQFDDLKNRLRKLGKGLGKARELDVAIQDARSYKLDTKKLKRKRKKARKSLREVLDSTCRRKILDDVHLMQKKLDQEQSIVLDPIIQLICKDLNSSLKSLGKMKLDDSQKLHELRILLKKTRYALESMKIPVKRLHHLQDVLGRSHDLTVLQAWIGKFPQVERDLKVVNLKAKKMAIPTIRSALRHFE